MSSRLLRRMTFGAAAERNTSGPPFEVIDIPDKGRGLVANRDIAVGSLILCEHPLVTLFEQSIDHAELERRITEQLVSLSTQSRNHYMTLCNIVSSVSSVIGIFLTNALPCGPTAEDTGCVCPTASFINHSCLANSFPHWDHELKLMSIYTIRPIMRGEEITLCYADGTSEERQAYLMANFRFDCRCTLYESDTLRASNNRRRRIQELDIDRRDYYGDYHQLLCDARSILNLLSIEYNGFTSVQEYIQYSQTFQLAVAYGDQARASVFARRAFTARSVYGGPNSVEAQELLSFANMPARHGTFQHLGSSWKSEVDEIPQGLNNEQFEDWLFGECPRE